jgi:hypothetical protein
MPSIHRHFCVLALTILSVGAFSRSEISSKAVRRQLTASPTGWGELETACVPSGTVTLSDDFVMGTYTSEIDFSGKQLVIIGNGNTLDAGGNG